MGAISGGDNGYLFYSNGQGRHNIEVVMDKDYAKRFALDMLEAIDKMERNENHVFFSLNGTPFANKEVILSEIKGSERRIFS